MNGATIAGDNKAWHYNEVTQQIRYSQSEEELSVTGISYYTKDTGFHDTDKWEISENKIRKEHGMARRYLYS